MYVQHLEFTALLSTEPIDLGQHQHKDYFLGKVTEIIGQKSEDYTRDGPARFPQFAKLQKDRRSQGILLGAYLIDKPKTRRQGDNEWRVTPPRTKWHESIGVEHSG